MKYKKKREKNKKIESENVFVVLKKKEEPHKQKSNTQKTVCINQVKIFIMIDWVSIVRHSRRRFSNYVGTRAPIRMKKRRRTPPSAAATGTGPNVSPHDDRYQYSCCCTHVSLKMFRG